MNAIIYIYLIVAPIVIWSMDSININQIFKQGRVIQANICYFLIGLSLIYLVSNFLYDFFFATQLI